MKTDYEFIHFVQVAQKPKTAVFDCLNNRSSDKLGEVKWYPAWRQYCYFPAVQAVYSAGCLRDIQEFLNNLRKTAEK